MSGIRALVYGPGGTLVANHGHPARRPPLRDQPPLPPPPLGRRWRRHRRLALGALNTVVVVTLAWQLPLPH